MKIILPLMLVAATLTGASPAREPRLLDPAQLNPAAILPPPPPAGSTIAAAERRQLHDIDTLRTPEQVAHARSDDAIKDVTMFVATLGPRFDVAHLPRTKTLFDSVRSEEKAAATRAKEHFQRNRPWIGDATLHPCSTADEPRSSYPSGHVTMGYAMGHVLAKLVPAHAAQILARAADYADSRLICEMHFQSDVAAGEVWGTVIAERLMHRPAFLAQFELARAELRTAGLD